MPIQFTGHAKRSITCPGFEPGACIYLTALTTQSSRLVKLRPIDNLLVKRSEERLTESIGKLTGRVETVEQMINALTNSVTVVSEHNLKLSARQSTREQLIIKYRGKKERSDVQIDATPGTVNFGTNTECSGPASLNPAQTTQYAPVSQSPALILVPLTPALPNRTRSPSPYMGGSRKSLRLIEKEAVLSTLSKSSAL